MKRTLSIFMTCLAFFSVIMISCGGKSGTTGGNVVQEDSLQRILKSGKLVIATDLTAVPIQFKDAQGKPTGLIVELMELAGKELGVTIEWQDMAWESLIPSLTEGKVDMIAANMSMTLNRMKSIRFSDPYMFTGVFVLARKDSGFTSWKQVLDRKNIAVTMGSAHAAFLMERYNYEPKQYESMPEWVSELRARRVDGIMDDELLLLELATQNPDFTVLPDAVRPDTYGMAFRQGASEDNLVSWINWFLKWEKLNGNFGEIYKKYVGKDWEPNPIIQ